MINPKVMKWTGNVALMGDKRNAYRVSLGKPWRKRPRPKWEDNIVAYLLKTRRQRNSRC
jgi:hypothetical protein